MDAGAAKKREVAQTNGMPYFRRKNGSLPAETGGLASLQPVAWHSCVGCAGCVCLTSQDSHLDVYNVSSGTLNPTIPYIQRPPTNHALHAKIACCQFNYWLILSYGFLSFSFWGGTRSLRMPALRPASQASPMRNPRKGTSVVLRDTIRLT